MGTVLAVLALTEMDVFSSPTQAKRNVTAAIRHVAEQLGNTVARYAANAMCIRMS
jgi:hypothetical protein